MMSSGLPKCRVKARTQHVCRHLLRKHFDRHASFASGFRNIVGKPDAMQMGLLHQMSHVVDMSQTMLSVDIHILRILIAVL